MVLDSIDGRFKLCVKKTLRELMESEIMQRKIDCKIQ